MVVDLAATFPASGRIVSSRPTVRTIPLGSHPYIIFYTATDEELIVLHIRHGAWDPIDPAGL